MTPEPESSAQQLLLTTDLLYKAKQGDNSALDVLMSRYLPRLYRWASGRLPLHARSLFDTSDLVHETLLRAIQSLDDFEVRGPGGFQAYVRQAIQNRIVDQVRWAARREGSEEASESLADQGPSPLEHAIGAELLQRYERACAQLDQDEQLFLHLRIELDFSYDEIAAIMDRPSRDAVRVGVKRSLKKLAELMEHER